VSLPICEPRPSRALSLCQTSRQGRRGEEGRGTVIREERNEDGGGIKLTDKLEDRMDKKKRSKQGKYEAEKNAFR
jgi:hypothetical protein